MIALVLAHSRSTSVGHYAIEATADGRAGRAWLSNDPRFRAENTGGALRVDDSIVRFIYLLFHISPGNVAARLFQLVKRTLKAVFGDAQFLGESLLPSNPISYSHDDSPCVRCGTLPSVEV